MVCDRMSNEQFEGFEKLSILACIEICRVYLSTAPTRTHEVGDCFHMCSESYRLTHKPSSV